MNRWLISLVLVPLLASLAGCDRGPAPTPSTQPSASSATPAPAAAPMGELTLPEWNTDGLPLTLQTKVGNARYEVRQSPDDPRKLGNLGALYFVHGPAQGAVACFRRVTEVSPTDPSAWYCLARAYERAGDVQQASAAYDKTVEIEQDYVPARVRQAALFETSDPPRAQALFEQVLKDFPASPAAHLGLGRLALAAGRLDEAANQVRQALDLSPLYGAAHAAMAQILRQQGQAAEAARHERRAADEQNLAPRVDPLENVLLEKGLDARALVNAVVAEVQRGNVGQGEALLNVALDISPDSLAARNALGALRLVQERYDEAAAEFRRVLEQRPDHALARTNLAFALLKLKQPEEAERLLRAVLAEQPENLLALERFALLKKEQNKLDEAVAQIDTMLQAQPKDAALRVAVAELLLRLDQTAEARRLVEEAVQLRPKFAVAHHLLGALLRQAGDLAGAQRAWTAAVEADPTQSAARMELLRLAFQSKDYAGLERVARAALQSRLNAQDAEFFRNALAWVLATSPKAEQRQPEEAARLAEEVCRATQYTDFTRLDTLAAAYAAAGRFDEARQWQSEAVRLARAAGQAEAARKYAERLALYEAGQPYYEKE